MTFQQKRRETSAHLPAVRVSVPNTTSEYCRCVPLSQLQNMRIASQEATGEEGCVLTSSQLNKKVRALVEDLLPYVSTLSLLVMHVAQLESAPLVAQARRRYSHIPGGQLEQVMANIKRVIRVSDRLQCTDGAGGVFVFPEVDRHGIGAILERVYQSISLLQSETVVPPLTRETTILLGYGTYPTYGEELEQLFYQTGVPVRRLTLRPALFPQRIETPVPLPSNSMHGQQEASQQPEGRHDFPFLDLPRGLPARLKQLLPYEIAATLRCAPVGREQQCLTVAMADPRDEETIQRLREVTGMSIFPVSCDVEELDLLLVNAW